LKQYRAQKLEPLSAFFELTGHLYTAAAQTDENEDYIIAED